jgi:anaerobic ribonucleoside-triphosphate reductase activating protein
MKIKDIYEEIISNTLSDVTFTGGDPMLQAESFCELAKMIKINSKKNIWCYTGYLFEEIVRGKDKKYKLLKEIDVLVDGKYISELKDSKTLFKGSSNQRIINVQESLSKNIIIETGF